MRARCRPPLSLLLASLIPLGALLLSATTQAAPDASPAAAEPTAKNCYGDAGGKWIFGETLVGLTNALGFENQARVGYCWPLIKRRGILFDFTNVEVGLIHYFSLPYSQQGGYVSVTPLSILNFRLEASGFYIWPVKVLDGASHYPRAGYDDRFDSDGINHDLDRDTATSAGGANVTFTTTVMAAVELAKLRHGPLEILVIDALGLEYWTLGDAPYYYNVKKDVILERSDWLLTNTALLLLSIPVRPNLAVRVGAMDMLAYLPRDGSVGFHQIGGLVGVNWEFAGRGRRVRGLQPFLYVSAYTHHAHRDLSLPVNFLIGVEMAVVLAPTPRPTP